MVYPQRPSLSGYNIINLSLLVGYPVPWDWLATNIKRAQDYIKENTTLGIPAIVQTEGICSSPRVLWSTLMKKKYRYSWLFDRQCDHLQLPYRIWMLLQPRRMILR
jgi:hypothetical protein